MLISLGSVLNMGENPFPTPALFIRISTFSFSKEEYINQLPEAIYEQPETPMSPKDIDSALAFLNTIDENYDIVDNVDS